MMLPVDRTNQTKKATQIITYHLGRVSAYATIGFVLVCLEKVFLWPV
jgi:sulfite exporter TauE/SafE